MNFSVFGNIAAFCDPEGQERLAESGLIDALLPVAHANDAARHSVIAAIAIGNLIGDSEKRFTALEGRTSLIKMVILV